MKANPDWIGQTVRFKPEHRKHLLNSASQWVVFKEYWTIVDCDGERYIASPVDKSTRYFIPAEFFELWEDSADG